jgi:peroxiredoxin (alkyl hydroperoxide reductase subunit C)
MINSTYAKFFLFLQNIMQNLNYYIDMKKLLLFLTIILFSFQSSWSQTNDTPHGPLIYGNAPSFKAVSTLGNINFPDDYYGKWKILFSHPADFTPVCTSEMLALAAIQNELKKLKTSLIVISTDGINSHIEWVKSMNSISIDGVSPDNIEFPIVTDADLKISKLYGIIPNDSSKKDIRGVFIIDPANKIRAFFYYPTTVGRNIDEIKRTLIALQTEDKHDVLIPANWQPGKEVLIRSPKTMKEAEKLEEKKDSDLRRVTWYLWYKKL